jgi:hypothetical protein
VGAGSHSAACVPGDYLVTTAPELPRWVGRLRRRMGRIVPWWDPESFGIGIPFIDYRRGDGLSIGPGQDRGWELQLIDDATDWVRDYRGLWGLDTGDPLGGERAPAGPRYQRTGAVRQAWNAPLAWAQLDQEPASQAEARRLWQLRPDGLAARLATAQEELEIARRELREATVADRARGAPAAGTTPAYARLRERVAAIRARQAELVTELDAWELHRDGRLSEPGPRDHLRHRALPLAEDPKARSQALRVWASASSTVLFAALGLLLVTGGAGLLLPAAAIVVAMLLVEAAVRRHLVALVLNLLVAGVLVVAAWNVVGLLLANVRLGAGVLLLVGAAYMGAQTIIDALVQRRPTHPT